MSAMSDFNKRVNSIVVKNIPADLTTAQLEELFTPYGKIVSSKILPPNPNFEGGYGFIGYADMDSCNQAVEKMNNNNIKGFNIRVSHSASRPANTNTNFDRTQNGFRTNGESNNRATYSASVSLEEQNGSSSPRFSSFRSVSERPSKPFVANNHELDTNKSSWNSSPSQPQISNSKSPMSSLNQDFDIKDHEPLIINRVYNIYLSNLEVPNVVFAATLDDYVNATLLITQMNKHEQLSKYQANSYKTKLVVGQICAALFNGDWYRARILEIGESRVRVQYIDWGNTGWCDSTLEIRPLPNEYFQDSALCVKCVLDGVPSTEKLSDEQKNAILKILVLDVKLEMTAIRIENGLPYIRLNLGERNLNNEIRDLLLSSPRTKSNSIINFNSQKLQLNLSEPYFVQLTTVDPQPECFHVLVMRDELATIMNVLKDWHVNKQPLTSQPKGNMLVCAQYEADDLWYRAWIEKITDNGYHVYFVDFGNEEIVSIDRLSECPESLKTIPWQSVQIKLANSKLTDSERYEMLKDFETERLEMKISQKNQDVYVVDLFNNGKSLVDYVGELRKKQPQPPPPPPPKIIEVSKILAESIQQPKPVRNDDFRSGSLPVQPTTTKNTNPSDIVVQQVTSTPEQKNDDITILIAEQRRQNRLLEQVLAAINTTNALLNQLVQR